MESTINRSRARSRAPPNSGPTMEGVHVDTEPAMARKRVAATKNGAGEIAARLVRLRKERGITQVELAARLGSTQSLVSKLENGESLLHGELIATLARIYGVTTDEILGVAGPKKVAPPAPVKDRRLVRRLQALEKLSKRDKEAVIRTLDAFLRKGEQSAA